MEELIKRFERVIATGAPDKDGMHPISAETVLEVVKELSEHGTNLAEVGTDCISRQAAIEALKRKTFQLTFAEEQNCEGHVAWSADVVYSDVMEGELLKLPSVQPETAKRIVGKSRNGMTLWYQCDMCNEPVDEQDNYCRGCGRRLIDG